MAIAGARMQLSGAAELEHHPAAGRDARDDGEPFARASLEVLGCAGPEAPGRSGHVEVAGRSARAPPRRQVAFPSAGGTAPVARATS
jgi:hypothetical protein